MQLHVIPKTAYAASDGVAPQWRFLLAAINTGPRTMVLVKVARVFHWPHARVRRVQSRDRIGGIIQGTRRVASGQAVVLDIKEGRAVRTPPSLLDLELTFTGAKGKIVTALQRVPLEPRPTAYLHFPLLGTWAVANARTVMHSAGRQFGFDLIAREDVNIFLHAPRRAPDLKDFASFSRRLQAPVAGTVAACRDDEPDITPTPGKAPATVGFGNYAMIETTAGDSICLAHLMHGSLRVRLGHRVKEGQHIARIGNSGATSQPHLHIEMLDGVPEDLTQIGALDFPQSGLPFGFKAVTVERGNTKTLAQKLVPKRMDILTR